MDTTTWYRKDGIDIEVLHLPGDTKVFVDGDLAGWVAPCGDGRWQVTAYKPGRGYRPAGQSATSETAVERVLTQTLRAA